MTDVELDLISDLDKLEMIEKMKRGGLCFVRSKRHVEANNRYLDTYDKSKPEDYLLYLTRIIYTVMLCSNICHLED